MAADPRPPADIDASAPEEADFVASLRDPGIIELSDDDLIEDSPQSIRALFAGPKDARTVLVVEDDPSVLDLVARALSTRYRIFVALNGEDALRVLEQMPAPPNAIVCDVMMPKMDGFAFVKTMKARPGGTQIPVLFLTARNHPLDVVQGINAGARFYMEKPFKLTELLERVGKMTGSAKA